jgi:hypothetical protein
MAYEDQQAPVGGLSQAATAQNPAQKIQELLLSRIHTPDEMKALEAQRQGALEQLQGAVRADPTGGYMPSQRSFDAWIENIGKTGPAMAAIRGVAEGNKLMQQRMQSVRDNEVTASQLGYKDIADRSKLDMQELSAIKGMGKGATITPEKLAQLRQSSLVAARNEFDPKVTPNMTPEERAQKINQRSQELFLNSVNDLREAGSFMPNADAVANALPTTQPPATKPVDATTSVKVEPGYDNAAPDINSVEGKSALRSEYEAAKQRANAAGVGTPIYERETANMIALRKQGQAWGYDPATNKSTPKTEFEAKPGQTASEAGITPVKFDQVKESPFAPALDLKPVLTASLPQMQEKAIKADREAYLKSDEFTGLNTQAAGAKELMKFVEAAIESPAKTNSLSGLNQMLNSYASAAGIPLDQKTKDQMLEFVKLNQTANAMGLVGQLMQRGVQTDKDFVRIMQAAFDTSLTPEQRRASMRQYADNLNATITKQRYAEQYMNHPYSYGNERNWESEYSKLKQAGAPESVFMPNKKVLPYDEAAKTFWGTEQGSKYKPSKDDSPEEAKRKQTLTIKALNAYNTRMREKLKTGAE